MPRHDAARGFPQGDARKRLQPLQAAFVQITKLAQKSQCILLSSAGMRAVDFRGQRMQLLMQGLDGQQ